MALIHSIESDGNWLFKYRGQVPVVLFVLAVPAVYFNDNAFLTESAMEIVKWSAIAVCFLGFFVRGYTIGSASNHTSGRNREKQVADALNVTGIYSAVRHPLYLGNYFIWIGIVIYIANIYFFLVVSLMYWIYYERIMFAEERFLERKFKDDYLNWSMGVPAFVPSFKNWVKNEHGVSWKASLRREYSGFLSTVFSFLFIDLLRDSFVAEEFVLTERAMIIFGAATAFTLTLKMLKKYTPVLKD
ncbi:MAG: DUF1295 domain-containing protein [Flavobacteriales bacterium]|nr:DUF1295 domain-containing protein [Flavobacteriales bacterium]